MTNFRLFQTEFADDNFEFDENGRKLSKRVENTVGKGEIAHYEQFLLFLQCFQKACFPGASKGVTVWESVKLCSPCSIRWKHFMRVPSVRPEEQESVIFGLNIGNPVLTLREYPQQSSMHLKIWKMLN